MIIILINTAYSYGIPYYGSIPQDQSESSLLRAKSESKKNFHKIAQEIDNLTEYNTASFVKYRDRRSRIESSLIHKINENRGNITTKDTELSQNSSIRNTSNLKNDQIPQVDSSVRESYSYDYEEEEEEEESTLVFDESIFAWLGWFGLCWPILFSICCGEDADKLFNNDALGKISTFIAGVLIPFYSKGLILHKSGEDFFGWCVFGLIVGLINAIGGMIWFYAEDDDNDRNFPAFAGFFACGATSLAGFFVNPWCFIIPVVFYIVSLIAVDMDNNDSVLGCLIVNSTGLCIMLFIWGYVYDIAWCIIVGVLPILIAICVGSGALFNTSEEVIHLITMIVETIGFSVCVFLFLAIDSSTSVGITIIMIGITMALNIVIGTIILIIETSHALGTIGHPLYMSLFTLFEAFCLVCCVYLWIYTEDWKMALTATILVVFFCFFGVVSMIGYLDESSSGFVKVFGDDIFEDYATPIFAFLWLPMLILPIFYDFVFSESYSLHPLCWASVCLGIIFFGLMISGWKLYADKHSNAILLMELLVSFAISSLVTGLWLCKNQDKEGLRVTLVALGGFGLFLFVILIFVLYKKHVLAVLSAVSAPEMVPPLKFLNLELPYVPKPKPKPEVNLTPKRLDPIVEQDTSDRVHRAKRIPPIALREQVTDPDPMPKPPAKPPNSYTLITPDEIESLCIIGQGGFGQVLLVQIPGIEEPCVFKKMLRKADKKLIKELKAKFKTQKKMYEECREGLPKPLYIFNFLNKKLVGDYGFSVEFCRGGNISEFSKLWCIEMPPRKHEESESESESSTFVDIDRVSPGLYNPFKLASIWVSTIECIDDVLKAFERKKTDKFTLGFPFCDIKPDKFLVRIDPKTNECKVVLGDLGLAGHQDSFLPSSTPGPYSSEDSMLGKKKEKEREKDKRTSSICGSLIYNAPETLLSGIHTLKSVAYSLGMALYTLFNQGSPPSLGIRREDLDNPTSFITELKKLIEEGEEPMVSLESCLIFRKLKGKAKGGEEIAECIGETFAGLTKKKAEERMSIHEARECVRKIKFLIPRLGLGLKCPSIEGIVQRQLKMYDHNKGEILSSGVVVTEDGSWESKV
ncbi:hypothetical protein ADUPG1_013431 [Aduncisulcus paluster]|uniref:Protein kinase domain-containing protein n=1 Tax=Aduncisulcus paluster TaxID=2918883 RepID=A0ABQ5K2W4_9EUKA|nr:hypothetical protein ADUPG1_013431 [Aduncisulcus paluster]